MFRIKRKQPLLHLPFSPPKEHMTNVESLECTGKWVGLRNNSHYLLIIQLSPHSLLKSRGNAWPLGWSSIAQVLIGPHGFVPALQQPKVRVSQKGWFRAQGCAESWPLCLECLGGKWGPWFDMGLDIGLGYIWAQFGGSAGNMGALPVALRTLPSHGIEVRSLVNLLWASYLNFSVL